MDEGNSTPPVYMELDASQDQEDLRAGIGVNEEAAQDECSTCVYLKANARESQRSLIILTESNGDTAKITTENEMLKQKMREYVVYVEEAVKTTNTLKEYNNAAQVEISQMKQKAADLEAQVKLYQSKAKEAHEHATAADLWRSKYDHMIDVAQRIQKKRVEVKTQLDKALSFANELKQKFTRVENNFDVTKTKNKSLSERNTYLTKNFKKMYRLFDEFSRLEVIEGLTFPGRKTFDHFSDVSTRCALLGERAVRELDSQNSDDDDNDAAVLESMVTGDSTLQNCGNASQDINRTLPPVFSRSESDSPTKTARARAVTVGASRSRSYGKGAVGGHSEGRSFSRRGESSRNEQPDPIAMDKVIEDRLRAKCAAGSTESSSMPSAVSIHGKKQRPEYELMKEKLRMTSVKERVEQLRRDREIENAKKKTDVVQVATRPVLGSKAGDVTKSVEKPSTSAWMNDLCLSRTPSPEPCDVQTQEPGTSTQEPLISTQEAVVITHEHLTSTQEPLTSTQVLLISTQEHVTTTQEHITFTQEPLSSTQGPMTLMQEPRPCTQESLTSTQEYVVSTQQSATFTEKPTSSGTELISCDIDHTTIAKPRRSETVVGVCRADTTVSDRSMTDIDYTPNTATTYSDLEKDVLAVVESLTQSTLRSTTTEESVASGSNIDGISMDAPVQSESTSSGVNSKRKGQPPTVSRDSPKLTTEAVIIATPQPSSRICRTRSTTTAKKTTAPPASDNFANDILSGASTSVSLSPASCPQTKVSQLQAEKKPTISDVDVQNNDVTEKNTEEPAPLQESPKKRLDLRTESILTTIPQRRSIRVPKRGSTSIAVTKDASDTFTNDILSGASSSTTIPSNSTVQTTSHHHPDVDNQPTNVSHKALSTATKAPTKQPVTTPQSAVRRRGGVPSVPSYEPQQKKTESSFVIPEQPAPRCSPLTRSRSGSRPTTPAAASESTSTGSNTSDKSLTARKSVEKVKPASSETLGKRVAHKKTREELAETSPTGRSSSSRTSSRRGSTSSNVDVDQPSQPLGRTRSASVRSPALLPTACRPKVTDSDTPTTAQGRRVGIRAERKAVVSPSTITAPTRTNTRSMMPKPRKSSSSTRKQMDTTGSQQSQEVASDDVDLDDSLQIDDGEAEVDKVAPKKKCHGLDLSYDSSDAESGKTEAVVGQRLAHTKQPQTSLGTSPEFRSSVHVDENGGVASVSDDFLLTRGRKRPASKSSSSSKPMPSTTRADNRLSSHTVKKPGESSYSTASRINVSIQRKLRQANSKICLPALPVCKKTDSKKTFSRVGDKQLEKTRSAVVQEERVVKSRPQLSKGSTTDKGMKLDDDATVNKTPRRQAKMNTRQTPVNTKKAPVAVAKQVGGRKRGMTAPDMLHPVGKRPRRLAESGDKLLMTALEKGMKETISVENAIKMEDNEQELVMQLDGKTIAHILFEFAKKMPNVDMWPVVLASYRKRKCDNLAAKPEQKAIEIAYSLSESNSFFAFFARFLIQELATAVPLPTSLKFAQILRLMSYALFFDKEMEQEEKENHLRNTYRMIIRNYSSQAVVRGIVYGILNEKLWVLWSTALKNQSEEDQRLLSVHISNETEDGQVLRWAWKMRHNGEDLDCCLVTSELVGLWFNELRLDYENTASLLNGNSDTKATAKLGRLAKDASIVLSCTASRLSDFLDKELVAVLEVMEAHSKRQSSQNADSLFADATSVGMCELDTAKKLGARLSFIARLLTTRVASKAHPDDVMNLVLPLAWNASKLRALFLDMDELLVENEESRDMLRRGIEALVRVYNTLTSDPITK